MARQCSREDGERAQGGLAGKTGLEAVDPMACSGRGPRPGKGLPLPSTSPLLLPMHVTFTPFSSTAHQPGAHLAAALHQGRD